jgi:GNAT superfamily N-acetyltransferase
MANAKIVVVGPGEIGLIAEQYNQVFNPQQSEGYFRRRFQGRHNVSMLVALMEEQPVGFIVGFELMPTTYFSWLCGVLPDARRLGIATQLMQAQQSWAADHGYHLMRFECQNQHRPMLHVAIKEGYDLVGIRWDTAIAANVVIFEKDINPSMA